MKNFLGIIVLFFMTAMQVQAQLPTGFFSTAATSASDNWNEPVGAAFSKDGQQLFIWEKGGRVFVNNRRASDGLHLKQLLPVIDISDEVGNWSDHGLLGFALAPNFTSTNGGYIYLFYEKNKGSKVFYRLKVINKDRTFSYSSIISPEPAATKP